MPHRGKVGPVATGAAEGSRGDGPHPLRASSRGGQGVDAHDAKDGGHGARRGPRRFAREMALQMLYQHDLAGASPSQMFGAFDLNDFRSETSSTAAEEEPVQKRHEKEGIAFEYAERLVRGTLERIAEIDGWLREQAENWRIERMSAVDRNILRLAIYELAFEQDVPKIVILDEAIELAKKFGSEQSGAFVNGILDALLRARRFPGRLA